MRAGRATASDDLFGDMDVSLPGDDDTARGKRDTDSSSDKPKELAAEDAEIFGV